MLELQVDKVSVGYPGTGTVIDRFTATFSPGLITCLQAPTGRGKTTLLAILGGLLTPQAGQILYGGAAVEQARLRAISAWVLQSQNVLPYRTAIDNAALGAAAHARSWSAAKSHAQLLLAELGLATRTEAVAATLSGGERQRVCVARALVAPAPIILADEPTANLDRVATGRVMDAFRLAADMGRIVAIASHDPDVGERSNVVLSRW